MSASSYRQIALERDVDEHFAQAECFHCEGMFPTRFMEEDCDGFYCKDCWAQRDEYDFDMEDDDDFES